MQYLFHHLRTHFCSLRHTRKPSFMEFCYDLELLLEKRALNAKVLEQDVFFSSPPSARVISFWCDISIFLVPSRHFSSSFKSSCFLTMSLDKPLKWDTKLCVQTFCLPFFKKRKEEKLVTLSQWVTKYICFSYSWWVTKRTSQVNPSNKTV